VLPLSAVERLEFQLADDNPRANRVGFQPTAPEAPDRRHRDYALAAINLSQVIAAENGE